MLIMKGQKREEKEFGEERKEERKKGGKTRREGKILVIEKIDDRKLVAWSHIQRNRHISERNTR